VLVVLLFMVVYYRVPGALADVALILFVLINLAIFKLLPVTLTLPGIAGFLLATGTAVDANVLIFERIKEEMRKGKTFKTAMDVGFKRAWPSIRDGNASTLITAAILFTIGTSIIRGFSVTLVMGILISLFTALIVTRWIVSHLAKSPLLQRPEMIGVKVDKPQE
jgi:preprotein translocase subunit SecD